MVAGERTVQWHELEEAVADGWTLIDVRTPEEFAAGTVPGAVNIPVDEMRERAEDLRGNRALVFRRVGLRGHVAVTLLEKLGIEAANLDGGFMTWEYARPDQG
jgi:rhodanese-related sulfurtransferase